MAVLTCTVSTSLSGSYTKARDQTTPTESIGIALTQGYTSGVTANKADAFWTDERTLAATSETLDFTADLVDAFGDTLALVNLKELIIRNTATTSGYDLTITGNMLTAFFPNYTGGDEWTIPPGGTFHVSSPVDGFTVTNTTQDQLTIDSGANAVTYEIEVLGTLS